MSFLENTEKIAYKAHPSSFCAGVRWGIAQLELLLLKHGTIYIPNPDGLVHNDLVKQDLAKKGAIFVPTPEQVPFFSIVANSMHGLSPLTRQVFIDRKVGHYDLSCPLVSVVHANLIRAISEARSQGKIAKLLYSCKNTTHPEPRSVIELAPTHVVPITSEQDLIDYQPAFNEMYFADSQTTINTVKALTQIQNYKDKFPGLKIRAGADGCFATHNRQLALHRMADSGITHLIVFGSPSSSNTTELVKIGKILGLSVDFMQTAQELKYEQIKQHDKVGLHAGASVPPEEADEGLVKMANWGYKTEELRVADEPTTFNTKPAFFDYRSGIITEQIKLLTVTY